MPLRRLYRVIQDTAGNIVTNVQTTVRLAGSTTLAALYADAAGALPLGNPLLNDPNYGSLSFYISDGLYDLFPAKTGYTFEPQPDTLIGTPPFSRVSGIVSALNGAPRLETPTVLIPAGARVMAVFVTNEIGFGNSQGATGYDVGDQVLTNRWGDNISLAQDHTTTQGDMPDQGLAIYPAGSQVFLSARNGLFDGTGRARVEVEYYLPMPA